MPSESVSAEPGWDEDLAWLDRDPMTAAEFEASLDRLCERDEGPGEDEDEDAEEEEAEAESGMSVVDADEPPSSPHAANASAATTMRASRRTG